MDAVVDVVVLREGSREPQAHGLDGASLAGGSALGGRGGVPALPADARDMGIDLDGRAVGVVGTVERELEVLEGEAAAGGAGGRAVGHGPLPAHVGDVGAVAQGHGLLLEGVVDVGAVRRGGGVALLDEPDLNSLEGTGHTGGAGLLAVLGPGHPADVGGVDAVVDVVVLREGAREPQAHRLDGASLAGGAALGGRGGVPALPADATYICVNLHRAIFNGIQDADLKILH